MAPPGTPAGMPYHHGPMHGMMQNGEGPMAFHKCAQQAMAGDQTKIAQEMKTCSEKHTPNYGANNQAWTGGQNQAWTGGQQPPQQHQQAAPMTPPSPEEMMKQREAMMKQRAEMMKQRGEMQIKRLDMVKHQMQITPAQEEAWKAFTAAIQARMGQRGHGGMEMMKEMAGKSPLERMEAQLTRMEERIQGKRKILESYRALDGLLDERQRQMASRYLSRYTMGGMSGMGGHGPMGGGYGAPGMMPPAAPKAPEAKK